LTTPKTSSFTFDPLIGVHSYALFICNLPHLVICLFVSLLLTMLIFFPSAVFQCFSKSDKWGWFTRWPPLSFNKRWNFHQSYLIQWQHLLKMISYFSTVLSPQGAWWAQSCHHGKW